MKKSFLFGVCAFITLILIGLLGDVPAEAKLNIPEDAYEYNGHYYYYYEDVLNWYDAEAKCEEKGGHLVTFSDAEEEDAVWSYMGKNDTPVWIGLYNDGVIDRVFGTVEDKWKWVTGEKIKYKNWAENEPDHLSHFIQNTYDMFAAIGKGENVSSGQIEGFNKTPSWGDFDDVYCLSSGTIKGYICEWDLYDIDVETKTVQIKAGKKYQISYKIYDKAGHIEIKNAQASFKSSSKKIAKVSKDGKITGVKKGNTTIKVSYKGTTVKIKVKVKK